MNFIWEPQGWTTSSDWDADGLPFWRTRDNDGVEIDILYVDHDVEVGEMAEHIDHLMGGPDVFSCAMCGWLT